MFDKYYDKNQVDVRHELFDWIEECRSEIEGNIHIVLRHKELIMETWLNRIVDLKCPADELVIYCLAKKYYKHVVIYTATYSWSTLARHFTYTKEEICNKCQIQLIFRGPGRYAEIRLIGMRRSESNVHLQTSKLVKDEVKKETDSADSNRKRPNPDTKQSQ